jgi:hypothetical protein
MAGLMSSRDAVLLFGGIAIGWLSAALGIWLGSIMALLGESATRPRLPGDADKEVENVQMP